MSFQTTNPATPASVKPGSKATSTRRFSGNRNRLSTVANRHAHYESLKASLTAQATTSAEYEAACRQAALIAGV